MAVAIATRGVFRVAVRCTVVLTGTALTLIFVVPGVAGTELATTLGAVTLIAFVATTGRTTVVLADISLVAILRALVLADTVAVAAIVSVGESQSTALGRSALPTAGSAGPLSLSAAGVAILARSVAGAGTLLAVVVAIATNQTLAANDWVFAKLGAVIHTHITGAAFTVVTTIRGARTTGVITA